MTTEEKMGELVSKAMEEMSVAQVSFTINHAIDKAGVWDIVFLPSMIQASINLHDFHSDEQITAEIVRQVDSATT